MPFDVQILTRKVEGLKEAFQSGRFADALVGALNTGNGLMQQRIFHENTDVKGQNFGVYIGKKHKARLQKSSNRTQNKRNKVVAGQELTSYQRKRLKLGRQISRKDLEFTGGMRRAIETGGAIIAKKEDELSAVLQFNNDTVFKIARGQEQQIANIRNGGKGTTKGSGATKIFGLNTSEKEKVIEQGAELIKEILKPK